MSANQSSQTASDFDNSAAQDSSMDGTDLSLATSPPAQPMTPEPTQPELTLSESMPEPTATVPKDPTVNLSDGPSLSEDWEAVNLPGTVSVSSSEGQPKSRSKGQSESQAKGQQKNQAKGHAAIPTDRENELLTLIHDLNKCNDALLARVSQLETALNDSHQVLHNETEKAKAAQSKMVEQVSMQQASTQQLSQTAQQQIAKLVDQLETAEQAFERQQLINETLLSELGNAQERVAQLEHESALSAQQHAEEVQASVQAETTIKDLRSRLQRQQRYTLQFKAALEKSLTVTTTRSTESRAPQPILPSMTQPIWDRSANSSNSVSMPKAQRIMPWAGAITSPFEGIDPHLENLIRGANQSSLEPNTSFDSASFDSTKVKASDIKISEIEGSETETPEIETPDLRTLDNTSSVDDTEAESQLWQDLERVADERVTERIADEPISALSATDDAAKTHLNPIESPKFNWQQSGSNQSAEVPSPTLIPTSAAEILTATPAALTAEAQEETPEAPS